MHEYYCVYTHITSNCNRLCMKKVCLCLAEHFHECICKYLWWALLLFARLEFISNNMYARVCLCVLQGKKLKNPSWRHTTATCCCLYMRVYLLLFVVIFKYNKRATNFTLTSIMGARTAAAAGKRIRKTKINDVFCYFHYTCICICIHVYVNVLKWKHTIQYYVCYDVIKYFRGKTKLNSNIQALSLSLALYLTRIIQTKKEIV